MLCKNIDFKCSIEGDIKYNFFPSPRIKINNLKIYDYVKKNETFGKVEKAVINISLYNLLNKKEFKYTKIELDKLEVNLDLEKYNEFKKFYKKDLGFIPIKLNDSIVNFFDRDKYITNIQNINLKYKSNKNSNELVLKGIFLNDEMYINFKNMRADKNSNKIFTLKLLNSKLLTKIEIPESNFKNNTVNGNILLKKNKNRLTALFDYNYNNDQIIFKNANLNNTFLEGNFYGQVNFSPYFDFDFDVDLNGINFNKFYNFFITLDTKKIFKINEKINGKINLSSNKVYSKYNLINSFESQVKFINGNIFVDRLLLNMGKLGAADITGVIENNKKFTNFKFEKNIFIDNMKRFYNKFGIYNKEKNSSSLFVEGSFDLENLNLRFKEISTDQKLKDGDIGFIEKEFNNILLEDGYVTLFNFPKLKEFVKLVTAETN